MPSRLQPAFFGGLFMGVLSALPFVNACCCLWVIAGGVLTAYLLQERTTIPLTAGDGALGGLLAGVVGAVISSVLGAVIATFAGTNIQETLDQIGGRGELPPDLGELFDRLRNVPPSVWFLISFVFSLIVYPIFAMLGGLLGVAIFKKQPPAVPPPGTTEVLPPL